MNISATMAFRSISIESYRISPLHSYKVIKDENGNVISKERFHSHYVCHGTDKCFVCGKKMKDMNNE